MWASRLEEATYEMPFGNEREHREEYACACMANICYALTEHNSNAAPIKGGLPRFM